jgi:hypothetical protein
VHSPAAGPGACSCGHADCSSAAKHPRINGGLNAATTDAKQIAAWWSRWPRSNVGLRTGAPSGLVVVDIDPDHGGADSLEQLLDRHGALPDGRTVQTGSGGTHLYYRHPGHAVANSAGKLGDGIDIRGDGGYVIAPPSRHRNGQLYSVTRHGGEIPELPAWMEAALRRQATVARSTCAADPKDATAWGRAALAGEVERLRHAQPGARNDTLNRVAFRLGQIINRGALDEHEVEPLLIQEGIALGLREREVVTTVASGLHAGEGKASPTRAVCAPLLPEP